MKYLPYIFFAIIFYSCTANKAKHEKESIPFCFDLTRHDIKYEMSFQSSNDTIYALNKTYYDGNINEELIAKFMLDKKIIKAFKDKGINGILRIYCTNKKHETGFMETIISPNLSHDEKWTTIYVLTKSGYSCWKDDLTGYDIVSTKKHKH